MVSTTCSKGAADETTNHRSATKYACVRVSQGDVMDILLAMENYADLHKKNISAYLTARAWLKRRIQVPHRQDPLQPKPGKVNMMLSVLNRISDDDKRNYSRDAADTAMLEY